MSFRIQVSNPSVKFFVGTQVEEFEEAIGKIFPEDTEYAYFIWNAIPIRVSYDYDLRVNIDDVLILLEALLHSEQGSHQVGWGSSTFIARWDVEWADNHLTIASQWSSIAGYYEDLLNSRSQLVVEKDQFVYEWKALLRKLIEAIEISGIEITIKERLDYLYQIEAAIPKLGSLYQYIQLYSWW
jgi:hypothetical protein